MHEVLVCNVMVLSKWVGTFRDIYAFDVVHGIASNIFRFCFVSVCPLMKAFDCDAYNIGHHGSYVCKALRTLSVTGP